VRRVISPLACWRTAVILSTRPVANHSRPPIAGRIANGLRAGQLLPNIALRLHVVCRTLPDGATSKASIGTVVYEDWRDWSKVGKGRAGPVLELDVEGWRWAFWLEDECCSPLMCFSAALRPGVLTVRHFGLSAACKEDVLPLE